MRQFTDPYNLLPRTSTYFLLFTSYLTMTAVPLAVTMSMPPLAPMFS